MITLKNGVLSFTGKDEKWLKKKAKKCNMTPEKFINALLTAIEKNTVFIEGNILLERIHDF